MRSVVHPTRPSPPSAGWWSIQRRRRLGGEWKRCSQQNEQSNAGAVPDKQLPFVNSRTDTAGEPTATSAAPGRLWSVPWDGWVTVQVTAGVWIADQIIPYPVYCLVAALHGVQLPELNGADKEYAAVAAQLLQLIATVSIVRAATRPYEPLPKPWFTYAASFYAVLQALSTVVVAAGAGVLALSLVSDTPANGVHEWRGVAGTLPEAQQATAAVAVGAMVLAPAYEEFFFRGFFLPSLTRWAPAPVAVLASALLFAAAHPASALLPEALLGGVLGAALLAADGNLLVPTLAHALYNASVLLAYLAAAAATGGADVGGTAP